MLYQIQSQVSYFRKIYFEPVREFININSSSSIFMIFMSFAVYNGIISLIVTKEQEGVIFQQERYEKIPPICPLRAKFNSFLI